MSAVRNLVISEPLVDLVEPNQIVTNYYKVKEVDLYTVTIDDLTFESNFSLIAKRSDHIHALVTFFSVEFSKCLKTIGFSTCEYILCSNFLFGKLTFIVVQNSTRTSYNTLETNHLLY